MIDDEPGYRAMVQYALADEGYTVIAVESGPDALALLRERKVDIVLTDMKMPEMDGLEFVKQVKKSHPKTPVVLMTGYAVEDLVREALTLKATTCLRKPFKIEELTSVVEAALPA